MLDTETKDELNLIVPSMPVTFASRPPSAPLTTESKNSGAEAGIHAEMRNEPLGIPVEKKPPDKNMASALPVPVMLGNTVTGPMALTLTEEGSRPCLSSRSAGLSK